MVYDTTTPRQVDPNDTSTSSIWDNLVEVKPIPVPNLYFNRSCMRYAKKHHITEEEAIKRLYRP